MLELTAGIDRHFSVDIKITGLYSLQDIRGKLQATVVVPAAEQAAKDTVWSRHGGIIFSLTKGSGGTKLERQFAVCFGSLVVELRVVAKVGPGLGALGGAENAGDMQVGGAEMPGLVGVEVEPEGAELAEEAIVQQGDAPPAGGRGGDRVGVVPVNGWMSGRVREWMSGRGDGGMDG